MPWLLRILELCLVIALGIILYSSGIFSWLSESSLDALFRLRGSRPPSQQVVIIGVDEDSLDKIAPWPFPRNIHAQLMAQLQDAKAVAFDLIFSKESIDDHQLASVFGSGPPVFLAAVKDYKGHLLLPCEELKSVTQIGHVGTQLGDGGVIRKVELYHGGIPVLAAAMVPEAANLSQKEAYINFYGPEFTFLYVSYLDVLQGDIPRNFFDNRYVLVGSKAPALGDAHVTPFSSKYPIPGVEVQATILSNILEDSLIDDARTLSYAITVLFVFLTWSLWALLRESLKLVATVTVTGALCFMSYVAFLDNVFLNPVGPVFAVVLSYIVHLSVLWIWVTARLVREIKILDRQLARGLAEAFETLPVGLTSDVSSLSEASNAAGIHRHIKQVHDGIQALTVQNKFIKHLLGEETPPLALWQKVDGNLVLANARFRESWEQIFGKEVPLPSLQEFEDFIGKNVIKNQDTERVKFVEGWFKNRSEDILLDICSITGNGHLFHRVLVHYVQSSVLGFSGVLVSFTNVTEIRNLERLKGDILNVVSHELRLPLTSIMGFSEMLTESLKGENQKFALEIFNQSKRFSKMIDDFLDIARMESGRYQMKVYPYDLLTIIYDAISGITHMANKKQITFTCDLPIKVSPLFGDEVLLTQAILNIFDNAVKFSPQKSEVRVVVSEGEDNINLNIIDQGPGISLEEQKTIFEKFTRGHNQVKGEGFGLGLSFVQSVVDGHKGKVSINCGENGLGSCFKIILPKRKVSDLDRIGDSLNQNSLRN